MAIKTVKKLGSPALPEPVTVENAKVKVPPTSGLPEKPKTYGYENLDWKDKLGFFQGNKEAAQFDIERATNKANLQKAQGDTTGYEASTKWINQINTATGTPDPKVQQFNEFQTKQNDLMTKFEGMINQPTTYNPEADPRYQAYKTLYEKQAKKASQNAMETTNERGILNSTITSDRLGQIEQDAQGNALAAIPEFYAQDQQAQQNKLRSVGELLGFVTDEARNAQDVNYRDKTFDRGVLESDRSFGRGVLENDRNYDRGVLEGDRNFEYQEVRDAIADERYKLEFDEDVRRNGMEFALNKAMQQGQLDVSRMNASTSRMSANQSSSNAKINQLMDVWENTGTAPAGLESLGIEEGTPLPQKTQETKPLGASDYKTNPEFGSDYSFIVNNPEEAKKLLKENAADFIETYSYDGYKALLDGLPDKDENELLKLLEE